MALQHELYLTPSVNVLPFVRQDSLPEGYYYQDEGCSIAPECLNCPLEVCRYDMEPAWTTRYSKISDLYAAGFSVSYIAEHCAVGIRTVYRATIGSRGEL